MSIPFDTDDNDAFTTIIIPDFNFDGINSLN